MLLGRAVIYNIFIEIISGELVLSHYMADLHKYSFKYANFEASHANFPLYAELNSITCLTLLRLTKALKNSYSYT